MLIICKLNTFWIGDIKGEGFSLYISINICNKINDIDKLLRDASGRRILNDTEDNNINKITTWTKLKTCMKQYRLVIRYCQVKVIFFQTGYVCAKFNTEISGIQRTAEQNCAECPYAYNSTLAFQCKTYVHFYIYIYIV